MKRLLLMVLVLLCPFASYADNDGDILSEPELILRPLIRSPIIYPDVCIALGDLFVEAVQSTIDVRLYSEGGSTLVLTTSSYGQVVVDLDKLQLGIYTLVIDTNGRQFEATFVVFTTE